MVGIGSAAGQAYLNVCRQTLRARISPIESPGEARGFLVRLARVLEAGIGGVKQREDSDGSKDTAKFRLKLLLVADKAGCSPELIRLIKDDMIRVISKYMEIEKDNVRLLMDTDGSASCRGTARYSMPDIPIRSISNKGLY